MEHSGAIGEKGSGEEDRCESVKMIRVVMGKDLLGGISLLAMTRTTAVVLSSVSCSLFTIDEGTPMVADVLADNSGWSAGSFTGAAPDN